MKVFQLFYLQKAENPLLRRASYLQDLF